MFLHAHTRTRQTLTSSTVKTQAHQLSHRRTASSRLRLERLPRTLAHLTVQQTCTLTPLSASRAAQLQRSSLRRTRPARLHASRLISIWLHIRPSSMCAPLHVRFIYNSQLTLCNALQPVLLRTSSKTDNSARASAHMAISILDQS